MNYKTTILLMVIIMMITLIIIIKTKNYKKEPFFKPLCPVFVDYESLNYSEEEIYNILELFFDYVSPGTQSEKSLKKMAKRGYNYGIRKLFISLEKKYGINPINFDIKKNKKKIYDLLKTYFEFVDPNSQTEDSLRIMIEQSENDISKLFKSLQKKYKINPIKFIKLPSMSAKYSQEVKKKYSYYNFSRDPKITYNFNKKANFFNKKTEFTKKNMDKIFLEILYNTEYKGFNFFDNECSDTLVEEEIETVCYSKKTHNVENFRLVRVWLLEKINKTISNIKLKDLDVYSKNPEEIIYYQDTSPLSSDKKEIVYDFKEDIFNSIFKTSIFYSDDHKLIKFKHYKLNNINLENYKYIIRIFRNKKEHHFYIYCDCVIDLNTKIITTVRLDVIGILPEEDLTFKKMKEIKFNLTNNFDKKTYCNLNKDGYCDNKVKLSDEEIEKIKNEIFLNQQLKKEQSNYRCINKKAETKEDCVNIKSKNDKLGIWDAPCVDNNDCPYFKKNTNYDNNFGGCIDGKCQMPLNVKNIGFRIPSNDKPYCHNCVKTENCDGLSCNECCDQQTDKGKYKLLTSPDYAFENDIIKRLEQNNILKRKNLKASGLKL